MSALQYEATHVSLPSIKEKKIYFCGFRPTEKDRIHLAVDPSSDSNFMIVPCMGSIPLSQVKDNTK